MRLTLPVCYCQDANLRRMVFRLKVSEETYQDERRVKCNIFKMDRPDYAKECKVRQPHGIWLTGFASACLACFRQVRATCEQPFMPSGRCVVTTLIPVSTTFPCSAHAGLHPQAGGWTAGAVGQDV